jgi:hypothetical protein
VEGMTIIHESLWLFINHSYYSRKEIINMKLTIIDHIAIAYIAIIVVWRIVITIVG